MTVAVTLEIVRRFTRAQLVEVPANVTHMQVSFLQGLRKLRSTKASARRLPCFRNLNA